MKSQPVYLNLLKIKLPIMGVVSLLHRMTGVALIVVIPLSLYIFQSSLQGEQGFKEAVGLLNSPLLMWIEILIFSALMYHLFAGFRFLLMDAEFGLSKSKAIFSSWLVIAATAFSSVLFIIMRVLS